MESVLPLRDISFVNTSGDQQRPGKGSRSLIRSHAMREVRRRQALQSKSKHAARGTHELMPSRSKDFDRTNAPKYWSSDPHSLPPIQPSDHKRIKPASNIKVRRHSEKVVPAPMSIPTCEPTDHRPQTTPIRGMLGLASPLASTALSADGKIDPFDVSQITLRLHKRELKVRTITPKVNFHL